MSRIETAEGLLGTPEEESVRALMANVFSALTT